MTVISSKEFISNQERYFDMALDEQVFIQQGGDIFRLIKNVGNTNIYHDANIYEEILYPDEDLYSAITANELLEMLHEDIHQIFNEKK
ncbi:MAG: hypothetical protein FWG84_04170 [Bacteroidales bacterium]|nr:hypothetical protein [Bacteroidales bacterium]